MKLEAYNYGRKTTHHAKRYFDPTPLVVLVNTSVRFLSIFFWPLRDGYMSHRWTDFDDLYIIRHLSMQGCALWGSVDIPPHLGGQISKKKHNFVGMNRHFQVKHAKYSNFHVIETAWIPVKFCTPVKTTKYASYVVQKCRKHQRWQTAAILKNWKVAFDRFLFKFAQWFILAFLATLAAYPVNC